MATVANDQKGKHDAVLDFLIDKHEHDAARVVDTLVDLLHRRDLLSPDPFAHRGACSCCHSALATAVPSALPRRLTPCPAKYRPTCPAALLVV